LDGASVVSVRLFNSEQVAIRLHLSLLLCAQRSAGRCETWKAWLELSCAIRNRRQPVRICRVATCDLNTGRWQLSAAGCSRVVSSPGRST
jgi:hypothetical protein